MNVKVRQKHNKFFLVLNVQWEAVSELMKIFRQFHMYLDSDSLFPHSIRTDLTSFCLISFWLPGLILTIKKCSLFCKILLYNTFSLNDLNIDYMFEKKNKQKNFY